MLKCESIVKYTENRTEKLNWNQIHANPWLCWWTVPNPPVEATVRPLNSTAVLIEWKEPDNDPNSPVLSYNVEMLEETVQDMFLISSSVTVGSSVSKLAIGKLRPFINYIARVAVQTKVGRRFSSEVFFNTAKSGKLVRTLLIKM